MNEDKIVESIKEMNEETRKQEIKDYLEELNLVENNIAYHDAEKLRYVTKKHRILFKLNELGVKTV